MSEAQNGRLLTVIVPCYQVASYLNRCMLTLTEQTIGIDQMEIILIDDGSTDGTLEVCRNWKEKYPDHIFVDRLPENHRQGYCRNLGLKQARGTYIGFVDADDWIETDMYEKMIAIAEQTDCDMVECGCSRDHQITLYGRDNPQRRTGGQDRLIHITSEEERSRMIAGNLLKTYVVTKLYRRSFLEEKQIHFAEHMIYEDVFFMGLLNISVSKIGFLEERMYHYFVNPQSVSLTRNTTAHFDIVKVNRALYAAYEERGIPEGIWEAVAYDLLCTYYLTTMKMILLRFDEPPYELFCTVQQDIRQMAPDIEKNPYVAQYTTPDNQMWIALISQEVSRDRLLEIVRQKREKR